MAIYRLEFTDEGEPLFVEESNGSADHHAERTDDPAARPPDRSAAPQPPGPAA